MKNTRDEVSGVERLLQEAREDATFFHELVFNAEEVIGRLDYLTRAEKASIVALDPADLVAGLAGHILTPDGLVSGCGSSCGDSCNYTCVGSCGHTCSSSCDTTCGAKSCGVTSERFSEGVFTQPGIHGVRRGFFRPRSRT